MNYNIRTTLVLASAIVAATAAALSMPLDPTAAAAGTAAYAQTQGLTEIKIGALLEFGPSYDDTSSLKSMELSIQDINNDPVISTKYNVTLVTLDVTGLNPTEIEGVVQNAVQTQGINHFVGHSSSTVAPAKRVLDDEIPDAAIVSYGSSAPIIPLPGVGPVNLVVIDSLFRLIPNDSHQAASVIDLVLNKDGKTNVVIVVRESWHPIVNFLIAPELADAFEHRIPYTEAERFADPAEAVSSHASVAQTVDGIVGRLVAAEGADKVAVMFIGFPLDFEYHVKGVLSAGDGLANLHGVKWYSTATITGESAAVRDADVAEFAKKVELSGTRYTVLDNPVNADLCNTLLQQGVICDRYEYGPFAAYDAIHLLVDAIVTRDGLADGSIPGDERTARDLILDVSSGRGFHHLVYEGRAIGDGALGEYTLNAAGDLETPVTYTVLKSTTNPDSPWVPAKPIICR